MHAEVVLGNLLGLLDAAQSAYRAAADRSEEPMEIALLSYLFSTHLVHADRLKGAMDARTMSAETRPGLRPAACFCADGSAMEDLLEGEAGLVAAYDRALPAIGPGDDALRALLQAQRDVLTGRIAILRALSGREDPTLDFKRDAAPVFWPRMQ